MGGVDGGQSATEEGLVVGDTEGREDEDEGDTAGVHTVGMGEEDRVVFAEVEVCESVPHIKVLSAREQRGSARAAWGWPAYAVGLPVLMAWVADGAQQEHG
jgi:hypothetical protein